MSGFWSGISERERRLAVVTLCVLLAATAYVAFLRAAGNLRELDDAVEQLERALVGFEAQAARLDHVEREYAKVTEQHSSEWTQAEIHDRLRDEIDRLGLETVPPPGVPLTAASGARLVEIPRFPAGMLDDRGEGYREYRLRLSTAPTTIENLGLFLERLEKSEQLLRVDRLTITRPNPEAAAVLAEMTVTRTIIGEASALPVREGESAANLALNPGLEEWEESLDGFPGWESESVVVRRSEVNATEGAACLEAVAGPGGGAVYQVQRLRAGATYNLSVDVAATGAARLCVAEDESAQPFEGAVALAADGRPNRYVVQFTVPESGADTVLVRAPAVLMDEEGVRVYVDNVVLNESPGAGT